MPDKIVATDRGLPFEHYVRQNDGPVADLRLWPNQGKRTDLNTGANARAQLDNRRWMNLGAHLLSDFDIRISDFLPYNTPASLKLK